MGWINTLKNESLKFLGRHGMAAARAAGKALMPKFTKATGAFYKRNKNTIDSLGGIAQAGSDLAGNIADRDVLGGVRSVQRGFRSGKQLIKGMSAGRGAASNRGAKRAPDGRASAGTDGGVANQPILSGDTLARLTKKART